MKQGAHYLSSFVHNNFPPTQMRYINNVTLLGNVASHPEFKEMDDGHRSISFQIATNRFWRNSDGEKCQSEQFTDVITWGRIADFCKDNMEKKMKICVEGFLRTSVIDVSGLPHRHTEVVANNVILLNDRPEESEELEPSGDPLGDPIDDLV